MRFLKLDAMQPLIDQGRTVWLWPDRDGIKEWENLRDKLGSDKIQIYTAFFDRCYIPEEDGPKADVADIAIRLMSGGRVPRLKSDKDDGQPKVISDLMKRNPYIQKLIQKLDLIPLDNEDKTETH